MDPFKHFDEWLAEAEEHEHSDPNAMAVATATPSGLPSVRVVLLKEHSPDGFVFYTNTLSRKGEEISENPRAALCFHWKSTYKQVRIEGPVKSVSDEEADAYFASRNREKQLAASASKQSQDLPHRDHYLERVDALDREFADAELPRPDHWSGYVVVPEVIEFWTGRQDRMHHRKLYAKNADGSWHRKLLYP